MMTFLHHTNEIFNLQSFSAYFLLIYSGALGGFAQQPIPAFAPDTHRGGV